MADVITILITVIVLNIVHGALGSPLDRLGQKIACKLFGGAVGELGSDVVCRNCDGGGWVCENHPDRPWDGTGGVRHDLDAHHVRRSRAPHRPDDAVTDHDSPEWTGEDFARAKPASEVHGKAGKLLTRPFDPLEYLSVEEYLTTVLESIRDFGHGDGHGCGYSCATIAEKALDHINAHRVEAEAVEDKA